MAHDVKDKMGQMNEDLQQGAAHVESSAKEKIEQVKDDMQQSQIDKIHWLCFD